MTREHWGSRLGFVLAAAGSAVGLGNIWKFPYMTGANGGAAFLLIYLGMVFTIGLSVMLAEFAIGRAAQKDPVGAFAKLKKGPWKLVGYMGIIAGFIILSFYSVVAGWTLAYIVKAVSGALSGLDSDALGGIFGSFVSSSASPLFYHGLFMALTVGVALGGIAGGIERACKFLMPLLLVLLLVLIGRAVTLPGAEEGIRFFLEPDFSKVDIGMINAALGQAFFSLSLGMGAMITYGSYLSRKENLGQSAVMVVGLDSSIAILAGLLILPAVFAFGFDPAAGPGLTFITLPAVFGQMPAGEIFAALFFLLLAVAALTSAVSLIQPVVAYVSEEHGINAKATTVVVGLVIFALGVPSSLSMGVWSDVTLFGLGFLDLADYVTSNVMLPLGGILIAVFAGWVVSDRMGRELTNDGTLSVPLLTVWVWICRVVAPAAIAWIMIAKFVG